MPLYSVGSTTPDRCAQLLAAASPSTPVIVAHRGEGDVHPEHTLVGYMASLSADRKGIEVSVRVTRDGRVVCHHDGDLTRCTNATGNLADRAYADLRHNVGVDMQSWVGPSWANQQIPLFNDVLTAVGGRCVLFMEPKDATAGAVAKIFGVFGQYPDIGRWVFWKFYRGGGGALPSHATMAYQQFGMRPWMYMDGTDSDADIQAAGAAVQTLGGMLGMPMSASDAKIAVAVATGAHVMCWPVRRRSQVARLTGLGVDFVMASQATYLDTDERLFTSDQWDTGLRAPGDIQFGEDGTTPPVITASGGTITLTAGTTSTYHLGSMAASTAPGSYRLAFDMSFDTLPTNTLHSDVYFCHATDAPYTHQGAANDSGNHLVVRPVNNGACTVQLYSHETGSTSGTLLGALADTASPSAGGWMSFQIDVTPESITIDRTDVTVASAVIASTAHRGPYFGLAAGSSNVAVKFRNFVVTDL